MEKIGCIDIGTNSVRILGLEKVNQDNFIPIMRGMEIIRPGKGVAINKRLTADSIEAVKAVLKRFKESGERLGIDKYYAVSQVQ